MRLAKAIVPGKLKVLLKQAASPCFPQSVAEVLNLLGKSGSVFSVLQIGASDAGLNDPVVNYVKRGLAQGVFLEPLPHAFKKLEQRYAGLAGVSVYQCAVDRNCGERLIFSIDQSMPSLPEWSYQVAGFCREIVESHVKQLDLPDTAIMQQSVACITFEKLLEREAISKLDCLLIDTEGFDYEILQMYPFAELSPRVIVYENKHLENADRDAAAGMMVSKGYIVVDCGVDTICLLPSLMT